MISACDHTEKITDQKKINFVPEEICHVISFSTEKIIVGNNNTTV